MPCVPFVLSGVNVRLPVFNPDAYGEGLGLHGCAAAEQGFEGVPGGVPGAQDQLPAGQGFLAGGALQQDAGQTAGLDIQIHKTGLETDVCPQIQQFPPEVLQDGAEIVCAHMGFGVDQDAFGRAAFDQLF